MRQIPKNIVTLELQLAGYQAHLEASLLPPDVQMEHERFKEATSSINNAVRGGVAKNFFKDMEMMGGDFPLLENNYKQYLHESIMKRREIVRDLSCADKALSSLPPGLSFRPKQRRFFEKLSEYFSGTNSHRRSGFLKYPTGMGKTVIMGAIIRAINADKALSERPKVLVLSPRDIVNIQNENKIREWNDSTLDIRDVKEIKNGKQPDVTIATYNMAALENNRLDDSRFLGDYDIILLDECHRSFGPKVLALLRSHYPESVIIGFSATPYLGATQDAKKLRSAFEYFEGEIDSLTLKDACEDRDLAPIRVQWVRINSERFSKDDANDGDLMEHLDLASRTRVATKIAKNHIPRDERGIIFCAGVTHSKDTAKSLNDAGISAAHVDGSMNENERNAILDDFRAGKYQFVTNSDLLIEGFDDDAIMHAIMLRPTMSMWMYEQMIGRAARLDPNNLEKVTTVWDIVGQHSKQCTILGLHRLYGDHKEAYKNGEIIFGENRVVPELKPASPDKPGADDTFEPNGIAIGDDGMLLDFIMVEEVGVVTVPMTQEYFTKEHILADLTAFAQAAEKKDLVNLSTSDALTVAVCSNGEKIGFSGYLCRVGVILNLARNATEANSKKSEILKKLKEIAGIILMDEKYFTKEHVLADLTAFAMAAGQQSAVKLSTRDNAVAVCSNGEKSNLQVYIGRFGIASNMAKDTIGTRKKLLEILKKLKEIAGIILMDEKYFTKERILADLTAFAAAVGKESGEKLSTRDDAVAVCSNGEEIGFSGYVCRAGVIFNLAKNTIDADSKKSEILMKLKEIAGIILMDEKYFTKEHVLADLTAFATSLGKEGLFDLSTHDNASVMCSNGEAIRFRLYIGRAGVALKMANNQLDAKSKQLEILKKLKEMASNEG